MWGMSTTNPLKRLYVRATPKARHALTRLLSEVRAPELLGDEVTQEEFVCGTWLWLKDLDPKTVAAGVSPHILAIRETLAKHDESLPKVEDAEIDPVTAKPKIPRRKRGNSA